MVKLNLSKILFLLSSLLFLLNVNIFSQQPASTPPPAGENPDEVIRVSTDLIQTGVTVLDKKGKPVNDLKKEDFDLRVDGQPVSLSFFDNVAGRSSNTSVNEKNAGATVNQVAPISDKLGRIIIFFVDDVHLSADSHNRTRKMISNFIQNDKRPGDLVAIVSSSGKIGFLQQFTDNDTVLQAAVARIVYGKDYSANDRQHPPMSQYEAQLVDRGDSEVTNTFVDIIMRDQPGQKRDNVVEQVRSRARDILLMAEDINKNTYSALEQSVRGTLSAPGRKIIFLISDGFLLDTENSNSSYRLHRVIDAAARSNSVIYSINARGLEADLPEGTATNYRVQSGERFESSNGLNELADSTGGKFIRNTNDIQTGVSSILEESTHYYLLAWQPEIENGKNDKLHKIEVKIIDRPELSVRVQNGYLSESKTNASSQNKSGEKTQNKNSDNTIKNSKSVASPDEQNLDAALVSQFPLKALPTSLLINYFDVPNDGGTITGILKVTGDATEFTSEGDKAKANVDILGVIYDSDGKRVDFFRKLLTIETASSTLSKNVSADFHYTFQNKLKPGLYQVRVASRDLKSGRLGNSIYWIDIPDLLSHKLALSSLIVSERADTEKPKSLGSGTKTESEDAALNIDRRFNRLSYLRYILYIYNSSQKDSSKPDVTVKTELMKGNTLVVTTPEIQVPIEGQDLTRLFYGAEIPLKTLSSGQYKLKVTIFDRIAKAQSTKTLNFEIK